MIPPTRRRWSILALCALVTLTGILLMPPLLSLLAGDLHWTSRVALWTAACPMTLIGLVMTGCALVVPGGLFEAIRRGAGRFPRLAAAAAGLGFTLAILGVAECCFYLLDAGETGPEVLTRDGPSHFIGDDLLGYAVAPGSAMTSYKAIDGRVAYDVVYTIDAEGHRITPSSSPDATRDVVIFFGCSNTFGEGVHDDETLPYYVGLNLQDHAIINAAFRGYGPQQMLAMLEDGRLDAALEGRSVTAVYLFIDAHVQRAIGSMAVVTAWGADMPRYVLDASGQPQLMGSFRSSRPFVNALYAIASKSNILRHYRVELPPRSDAQFLLTARLIEASALRIANIADESHFYVVLHPSVKTGELLKPHLEGTGVEVLDYTGLWSPDDTRYAIEGDWHPTPLAHRTLADKLAADIASHANVITRAARP